MGNKKPVAPPSSDTEAAVAPPAGKAPRTTRSKAAAKVTPDEDAATPGPVTRSRGRPRKIKPVATPTSAPRAMVDDFVTFDDNSDDDTMMNDAAEIDITPIVKKYRIRAAVGTRGGKELPPNVAEFMKLKERIAGMYAPDDGDVEMRYFKGLTETAQENIIVAMQNRITMMNGEMPMRFQIINHVRNPEIQRAALTKYEALIGSDTGNSEYFKMLNWLDGFMRIPFDVYRPLPVTLADGQERCREYMNHVRQCMDSAVYGQEDVKLQVMQFIAQWVANPEAAGNVLAIYGPAGIGKTTLVKEGISRAIDRPFHFIALGGASDSAYLEGVSYAYEGSSWGQLTDILITSHCMNPVIFFDELDKVSTTPKGDEIINVLMHLTDSAQNEKIADKYFSGIPLDFSKCLIIFSLNDPKLVSPILLDRAHVLKVNAPTISEKMIISQEYMLPILSKEVNLEGQIKFTDEAIRLIIRDYSRGEAGVRELRRGMQNIIGKLNMLRFMDSDDLPFKISKFRLPFTVGEKHVRELLANQMQLDTEASMMYV